MPTPGFWAVIPAGGAGTRLWPLSRASHPKFLHDLTGTGRTLLQDTVDRLSGLAGPNVLVVTGAAHAAAVRSQLPTLPDTAVLTEPNPRDSMAAIGLAAAVIERQDPDAIIGSFAADHLIPDATAFAECVRTAIAAAELDLLVTLGVEPTEPSTAFGYIHEGDSLAGVDGARTVRSFVEKPSAEIAAQYLASGEYRWNAGMFVVRARVLLDLLAQWHPELARDLRLIAADPARLDELWPGLEKIAIDHAVAEPAADAGRVAVVRAAFSWEDIGDFAALTAALPTPAAGPAVPGDAALVQAIDTTGLVVPASGRLIAVVGLSDVVVVDTGDAVLVTTADRAQDVKKIVEALKQTGRADLV